MSDSGEKRILWWLIGLMALAIFSTVGAVYASIKAELDKKLDRDIICFIQEDIREIKEDMKEIKISLKGNNKNDNLYSPKSISKR